MYIVRRGTRILRDYSVAYSSFNFISTISICNAQCWQQISSMYIYREHDLSVIIVACTYGHLACNMFNDKMGKLYWINENIIEISCFDMRARQSKFDQAEKLFIALVADNSLRRKERTVEEPRGGRSLYCWVSCMVRNSLNEFTPCFFFGRALQDRKGRGGLGRTLSSCFSASPTRYIRNPALFLECLLIRHTLTSRRAISVKRQFIFPALYPLQHGTKVRLVRKGKRMGRSLTLWSWSRCVRVRACECVCTVV